MTTILDDWRRVAADFTARVEGVAGDRWSAPSPCEGWVARDIVAHLVEWVPPFLEAGAGVQVGAGPAVVDDPVGAWKHLDTAIEALLADPGVGGARFEHPQAGAHPLDRAISMFILGDVLIHTWDLARATGQDETLDAAIVSAQLAGMEALDEDLLVSSGHYKARQLVAPDADEQTRLIALTGRRP